VRWHLLRASDCSLICVTGSRIAKKCGSNGKYFASIDECITLPIASSKVFTDAISAKKRCAGGHISTTAALEALRFCDVITSALNIAINDTSADFTVLHDIETIEGRFSYRFSSSHDNSQGSLLVQRSSMTTLAAFAKLSTVSNGDSLVSVAGGSYAVAIYGLVSFLSQAIRLIFSRQPLSNEHRQHSSHPALSSPWNLRDQ
jgi:hypothetical protein